MVSHGMGTIEKLCDRAIWLDRGKIRLMGPASEVVRLYEADLEYPFRGEVLLEKWGSYEKIEQMRVTGDVFDEVYFENCCGRPYQRTEQWLRMFNNMAINLAGKIAPQSVMDAGCGKGFLVESLRKNNVEAFGVDISQHAIDEVLDETKPYCKAASITEPFDRRYGLIICIEVLQNLSEADGMKAIDNFCRASDQIIISVNPVDRRSPTYVNVQPIEYWEAAFAERGYEVDTSVDIKFITPWAMRFRKKIA